MDSFLRDRLSLLAAIGCGVAFGVSGIYTYYVTNRQINKQIDSLTNTIKDLKQEVKELRIASVAASMAASQSHSPIHSQVFEFSSSTHQFIDELNCSEADFDINRCQIDSQLKATPIDNSVSTDDNEEYFDITEGETESEKNVSIISNEKNVDTLSNENHKIEFCLEEWIEEYDKILADTSVNKKQLYEKIISIQKKYDKNGEILWRTAKATHLYGIAAEKEGNPEIKKRLAFEALDFATKAIKYDDQNAECHKWYAITIGTLGDYINAKEKISNGHQFKKHVDMALKLKPNDSSLHHLLGRFCYEIASLSWVERKVANALFSKVPESTLDDSYNHLIKAYELRPDWKENLLFIAKIMINQKKYTEAIKWIDRGLTTPTIGEDDVLAHEQLALLDSKYSKYR